MRRMHLVTLACVCAAAAFAPARAAEPAPPMKKPLIQIAILLDTSGSMQGLIDQAKAQLWTIVNESSAATREGQAPELQVALYEYGKGGLPREAGFIRMITPLTTDLDRVSEELFALKTRGGSEFCGTVIQQAVLELAWSAANDDIKAIFIAGNEPFTQGKVDYRAACAQAVARGITVNTIFCGRYDVGVRTRWQDGAFAGAGVYVNIDHARVVAHVAAPQDAEIARLGVELNKTYIPYGALGQAGAARQAVQDANAWKLASWGSHVQRAVAKALPQYSNAPWDLVDAVKEGVIKVEGLKEEDLPEAMRMMTPAQRLAYVEARAKERAGIQARILQLYAERQAYLAQAAATTPTPAVAPSPVATPTPTTPATTARGPRPTARPSPPGRTLDQALIEGLRSQAQKKRYLMK